MRFEVLIAGSGPAALEATLVLDRAAGALVHTTMLTPDEDVVHLPMTVLYPSRCGAAAACRWRP